MSLWWFVICWPVFVRARCGTVCFVGFTCLRRGCVDCCGLLLWMCEMGWFWWFRLCVRLWMDFKRLLGWVLIGTSSLFVG